VVLLRAHLDIMHDSGAYDGARGVVAAIEVMERLRMAGPRLAYAIEVASFANGEGVRFDGTVLGSAALAGAPRQG
jgi:allantoate deiminase